MERKKRTNHSDVQWHKFGNKRKKVEHRISDDVIYFNDSQLQMLIKYKAELENFIFSFEPLALNPYRGRKLRAELQNTKDLIKQLIN